MSTLLQVPASSLNNRRTINAWALFDWANSSFALVIIVAIFPGYFLAVTDDVVHIGKNLTVSDGALYSYAISAAYLLILIASPFLSGIADYGGRKKFFLRCFTTMGSMACIALYFFRGMDQLTLGTVSFILATIGFAGGLVFYNAYLPMIATEDQYDRVSAKGFAYGYIGSVILLIVNLVVIQKYEWFGLSGEGPAVRIAFVMVGLWWFGFAQIPFRRLPPDSNEKSKENLMMKGFQELKRVWYQLQSLRNAKRFLLAFFFYSTGVQTVLFLAAIFAEKELGFATSDLILLILLLQIVAIGGAYLFAKISGLRGNKFSIIIMLIIWTAICGAAYFIYSKSSFYLLAVGVGVVMGGIQSLSRSTYSKLLPENTQDTTSFFSFYDVLEKGAIIVGTFSFGFIEQLTGSMRNSVLALSIFFIAGLATMLTVRIKQSSEA
ncbi:MAG: MFS transporter [Saprospiraceae bacterium]|nr:MFS transporter [Saprospiraceae bacterium]MDZ4706436.1 MFS transporter [Saprospiraceae bacterium]